MLRRRVMAPLLGLMLALSLAVTPVSAVPAPSPLCGFLTSIGASLPNIPFIQAAWHAVLADFGCANGVVPT